MLAAIKEKPPKQKPDTFSRAMYQRPDIGGHKKYAQLKDRIMQEMMDREKDKHGLLIALNR
jgi:hypothetical protein